MTEENKPQGSGKRDLHAELTAAANAAAKPAASGGDRPDLDSSSMRGYVAGSSVFNPNPK